MNIKSTIKLCFLLLTTSLSFGSRATIVELDTNFGSIQINLYDQNTPQTVANFLQYVEDGDFQNIVIHRSAPSFVIQGGGFSYNGGTPLNANNLPLDNVESNAAVTNEPVFSNVRGTISMAKIGGNPNSATNQWFINLVDNNALDNPDNLDRQNGGFTAFGEVIGDGMAVADTIAGIQRYTFGSPFDSIPLDGFSVGDTPTNNNFVLISNISVIDPAADTAANLTPKANVGPFIEPEQPDSSSSGGGSMGWLLILTIAMFRLRKASK